MQKKHVVGISIGDFNGIGPELILKTFSNPIVFNYCTPVIYGTSFVLKFYSRLFEMPNLELNLVKKQTDIREGILNIKECSSDRITIEPGKPSMESGKLAFEALQLLVQDVKEGWIDNILTAPIDKDSTKQAGLQFNGHTDFFAKEFDSEVLMVLVDDNTKVAMVTGHIPLNAVAQSISAEKIENSLIRFAHTLKFDFNILKPRIAVLGLNPHLGDKGNMGAEDNEIILPTITRAQEAGILAFGPYSPDGFFGSKHEKSFDGILGMYHDQVLIPFKQQSFSDGVNFTAGLPIVRTSPDHGVGYDIAGKGIADISSFVNALYLIRKLNQNRKENYDATGGFLKFREHRREKFSIGVPDLN